VRGNPSDGPAFASSTRAAAGVAGANITRVLTSNPAWRPASSPLRGRSRPIYPRPHAGISEDAPGPWSTIRRHLRVLRPRDCGGAIALFGTPSVPKDRHLAPAVGQILEVDGSRRARSVDPSKGWLPRGRRLEDVASHAGTSRDTKRRARGGGPRRTPRHRRSPIAPEHGAARDVLPRMVVPRHGTAFAGPVFRTRKRDHPPRGLVVKDSIAAGTSRGDEKSVWPGVSSTAAMIENRTIREVGVPYGG